MKGVVEIMRKSLRTILAIFFAATLLSTTVYAVQARWANVRQILPTISAASGCYSCSIEGLPGTTKIECSLTLYEKAEDGNFVEVSHVSETCYVSNHKFVGYYNIKRGKTYRLVAAATVTCNGIAEDVSSTFEKNC